MAEKKTYKCIGICAKEFQHGEWECFPGEPHKVETKTYYLADAPHVDAKNDPDGLALRSSRTRLHCVPETTKTDPDTGQMVKVSHPGCLFVMGKYDTDNPQEQFFIERSKHPVSYERWFNAYHTPKMKQNIKDGQLLERERNVAAKEKELNDLLAQVKAGKKVPA